jgi:hypothetical protein
MKGNTMLIAKPIIKDQYWVVTNGKEKVGNVMATGSGYEVKINGATSHFENTRKIKRLVQIEFQPVVKAKTKIDLPYVAYPTTGKVYNSVIDIKRKLHLFTKTAKSKCFHAAGWFNIQQGSTVESIFCPKYIFVLRYEFAGPYKTEAEAIGDK